ncbi:MAG: cytochrome P450 [Pseudomonadota bacterium]
MVIASAPPKALYRPPAPEPVSLRWLFFRSLFSRRSDVLHYVPEPAFDALFVRVPMSRRPLYLVNNPAVIREIMVDRIDDFPKSDILTDALRALVGDSIFTVSGETWRHQHRMIDQVFSKLRLRDTFGVMQTAIAEYVARLDQRVGDTIEIDTEMAYVTADVIFRTMFSRPITDGEATEIFNEFTVYQASLPHMTGRALYASKPHAVQKLPTRGIEAATRIRRIIARLVDERVSGRVVEDDICQIIATCRDPDTGAAFTVTEMVDQVAFFFLAGHETSASALTWALLCLSQDTRYADRIVEEVHAECGDGPIGFDSRTKLRTTNAVFREALRLYPPVSFISRTALRDVTVQGREIPKDSVMILAPWIVQRHRRFWDHPDHFDPDRFDREGGTEAPPGAWFPFGAGPRVCTGAAFATMEAVLVLGTLTRRYRIEPVAPHRIRPTSRLTVRPEDRIIARLSLR